jgi:hypothetical protein
MPQPDPALMMEFMPPRMHLARFDAGAKGL